MFGVTLFSRAVGNRVFSSTNVLLSVALNADKPAQRRTGQDRRADIYIYKAEV